jgi:hypothetical protein
VEIYKKDRESAKQRKAGIALGPQPAAAVRIIRRLVMDDASVFFTRHAERRMFERHVSVPEVLSVLRRGRIAS